MCSLHQGKCVDVSITKCLGTSVIIISLQLMHTKENDQVCTNPKKNRMTLIPKLNVKQTVILIYLDVDYTGQQLSIPLETDRTSQENYCSVSWWLGGVGTTGPDI